MHCTEDSVRNVWSYEHFSHFLFLHANHTKMDDTLRSHAVHLWRFNELFRSKRRTSSLRWVEVGQASVVMAISSPHRHDGQQAIQHCICQLKAKIPIWKKVRTLWAVQSDSRRLTDTNLLIIDWQEVYDTQDCSWKENPECSWAAHSKTHPVTSSTENMWLCW